MNDDFDMKDFEVHDKCYPIDPINEIIQQEMECKNSLEDMTEEEIDVYYWLKESSMEDVARYIAKLEEERE